MKLYENPGFTNASGLWYNTFNQALETSPLPCTWNLGSLLAMVSFHHTCGESTLLNEIIRNPWYSSIKPEQLVVESPPKHGFFIERPERIGMKLFDLLIHELTEACSHANKVYLLLSGGMDSRIIACALAEIKKRGYGKIDVTAVTWGIKNSLDVQLAEMISDELGFTWMNIDLNPEILIKNISLVANDLGAMTNAYHLHGMSWFENCSEDDLVIAGSYGDGIGRAEYSGRHVLDMRLMQSQNRHELINPAYYPAMNKLLEKELIHFRNRFPSKYLFEMCEYERQGHYMRNFIAYSMSIINKYCSVYQAFTHPDMVQYMWSIHPSVRINNIYAALLQQVNHRLSHIPWAKTGKALKGYTVNLNGQYTRKFNRYREWIADQLYNQLIDMINFPMLEDMKVFNMNRIEQLCKDVKAQVNNDHAYNLFLWLIGLSKFHAHCHNAGIRISNYPVQISDGDKIYGKKRGLFYHTKSLKNNIDRLPFLKRKLTAVRKLFKRIFFLVLFKPRFI